MGFSRQESWSGFPTPGDLPDPGIEPGSPALQAESLPSKPPGKPMVHPNWGTRKRGAFDTDTRTAAVHSGCPGPQGRAARAYRAHLLPALAQPLHRDRTGTSVHAASGDRFSRRQARRLSCPRLDRLPGPRTLTFLPSPSVEVFLREQSCKTFQV